MVGPGSSPPPKNPPLQAVFFDLGNTLLTERTPRAEVYRATAARHGLAVTAQVMSALMLRAHDALPRQIAGAYRYSDDWFRAFQELVFIQGLGLERGRFAALSAELFACFEDARTFALYPGARELLAELRTRRLRLGLISNWSARLPRLLAVLGLSDAFDFVLGSAVERSEKPEPGMFLSALRHARVLPAQALHAGDQVEKDARGALAVGLDAVLVDHAGRLGSGERAPCPVVSSLAELRDLILERAR